MKFNQTLIVFCVLSTHPSAASAEEEVHVREIRITPTGEAKPALKYKLLPTTQEQFAQDTAQIFERVLAGTDEKWSKIKSQIPDRQAPLSVALDQAILKRMETILKEHKDVLEKADRATRCDRCLWTIGVRTARRYTEIPLPEIENLRAAYWFVELRTRMLTANGDWKGALESVQTQLALAKHCSSHPTMIAGLSATYLEQYALDHVVSIVQLPGCANLYWPLTSLPDPLFDYRRTTEAEIRFLLNHIPEIREAEKVKKSKEEWTAVIERYVADSARIRMPALFGSATTSCWRGR